METYPCDFTKQLIALLPRLRIQALALTRNPSAASDLVQDAVTNALAARDSFTPGTNFPAWMHRILRNRFISDTRKRRPSADLDDVPEALLATPASHEDRLVLKELHLSLGRLPPVQRTTLLMVVLHGMSYEQVAEAMGCAVGTAKSRVFRARQQLQIWLTGETRDAVVRVQPPLDDAARNATTPIPANAARGDGAPGGIRTRRGGPDRRPASPVRISGGAPC